MYSLLEEDIFQQVIVKFGILLADFLRRQADMRTDEAKSLLRTNFVTL